MELYLDNVGIIKDSKLQLDGLTVITGKNSSGKTTVGKVMYSLLSAGSDLEEAFETSKKEYIVSKIVEVEKALKLRRYRRMPLRPEKKSLIDEIFNILLSRNYTRFSADELVAFLVATKDAIVGLTQDDYKQLISGNELYNIENVLNNDFYKWQQNALDICTTALQLIGDQGAFYNFIKDRTDAFINHEFNKQIKPVKHEKSTSRIELFDNEKCIVKAQVISKSKVEFSPESTFLYPCDRCIFIDNPYVIDSLEKQRILQHSMYKDFDTVDAIITSEDIADHDEILSKLILDAPIKNYFDDVELQNKFAAVFKKINDIVPGEFAETNDGYFYVNDGAQLSVKNLATGSKMFFIIKKLLLNGHVDNNTMLILDEPESHLHPEWINRFAEILMVLVETIGVKVLLTTHSPNLLLALGVYAREMGISKASHFYLAENMSDNYFSKIRCIDDDIGEGYSHLSLPFVEMNLKSKETQSGV